MFSAINLLVYFFVAVVQAGLKPKLIDVDINTFTINLDIIKKM